jgi:hypothetical protein
LEIYCNIFATHGHPNVKVKLIINILWDDDNDDDDDDDDDDDNNNNNNEGDNDDNNNKSVLTHSPLSVSL